MAEVYVTCCVLLLYSRDLEPVFFLLFLLFCSVFVYLFLFFCFLGGGGCLICCFVCLLVCLFVYESTRLWECGG